MPVELSSAGYLLVSFRGQNNQLANSSTGPLESLLHKDRHLRQPAVEHGHDEDGHDGKEHAAEGGDGHGHHDVGAATGGGEHGQEGEYGGGAGHHGGAHAPVGRLDRGGADLLDALRRLFAEDLFAGRCRR